MKEYSLEFTWRRCLEGLAMLSIMGSGSCIGIVMAEKYGLGIAAFCSMVAALGFGSVVITAYFVSISIRKKKIKNHKQEALGGKGE